MALSLLLSACAIRGPVLASGRTELSQTPFFPQTRHQCGPAALATVLSASGAKATPDALTSQVFLPARRGSLQVEMQAVPRGFGRLPLRLPRHLESIVAELEAGRPVLILHNYGLAFWPRWHYAVVVGYDPAQDVFVLRSGRRERQQMRTRHFMVYWHRAARWAMVVLRPGETPALSDPRVYLEAAADFERDASAEDARAVFDAAVRRWPQESVAWVGRGTAEYKRGNLREAARDYHRALELDATQIGARNNLAQALLDLRCPRLARIHLAPFDAAIDPASLRSPLREAVEDTLRQVREAAERAPDAAECSDIL